MSLFGLFSGDKSSSNSTTTSTTQTTIGSGLTATGVGGNLTYISNDPATALASLQASAYTTDRALNTVDSALAKSIDSSADVTKSALESGNFALSNAFHFAKDIADSATGLTAKTNEQFYNKLADNAGVAPQTLQQQQQAASTDTIKLMILAGVFIAAVVFISKSQK